MSTQASDETYERLQLPVPQFFFLGEITGSLAHLQTKGDNL
jgi:hypothetical protein